MEELLSLKWKNHSSIFIQLLKIVRTKQMFTDVTIACSGKFYDTHRMVLSACSDYFKEIFEHTECKKPIIVLNGIASLDLEALLDYMYIGEVSVKQCDLSSLIKAAECLQIKGLAVADNEATNQKIVSTSNKKLSISPTPKRKRKISETVNQEISEESPNPKAVKIDKNINSQNRPRLLNEFNDKVESPDSKAIFIKEEFDDNDPFIVEDSKPQQQTATLDNATDNLAYLDQEASSSTMLENNYYSENQDNAAEWSDTTVDLNFSSDSNLIDNGNQQSGACDISRRKCPFCNRVFTAPSSLNRHIRRHTGEKPFSCQICKFQTARKDSLQGHMLSKHIEHM